MNNNVFLSGATMVMSLMAALAPIAMSVDYFLGMWGIATLSRNIEAKDGGKDPKLFKKLHKHIQAMALFRFWEMITKKGNVTQHCIIGYVRPEDGVGGGEKVAMMIYLSVSYVIVGAILTGMLAAIAGALMSAQIGEAIQATSSGEMVLKILLAVFTLGWSILLKFGEIVLDFVKKAIEGIGGWKPTS